MDNVAEINKNEIVAMDVKILVLIIVVRLFVKGVHVENKKRNRLENKI